MAAEQGTGTCISTCSHSSWWLSWHVFSAQVWIGRSEVGTVRAAPVPATPGPCTVPSVPARYGFAKITPGSPCRQQKPSCSPLTSSPLHSSFMHTCTLNVCTLHAASALTLALCVKLFGTDQHTLTSRSSLPFARGCRVRVWFGFVGPALLPAFERALCWRSGRCLVGVAFSV